MMKAIGGFLLLALVACGPAMRDDDVGDDGSGSNNGSGSGSGSGVARECSKMDIIFVVDNSGSMEEEQSNLATNFPMFAQVLENYTTSDGQPLDYRVAITTTGRDISYTVTSGPISLPFNEHGENGAFQNNCNSTKRWLERTDPNMAQTLACRADVGIEGPGIEMPLLMTKWALADRVQDNTNAGFLRDDALLAVVILTDEDDASTTANNFTLTVATANPPSDWNPQDEVNFLDQLKGNRTRWAAGVIAGDGNCSSGFGDAADGVRLKEFVNLANSQNSTQAVFSSICDGDLTVGLTEALDTFQAACGAIIL
ncbi:MAG: VWA domain-containing protein [Kofleriaceae bacterium]|nr:VWA domain-containing protein [Kofleriaceae bacterium]